MKALLLTEVGKFSYQDVETPEISPDEVLIRVKAASICGSDVHGYDGSSGRRIPPIIIGHEAAGIIEKVGANVKEYVAGDHVTFDSTQYCGECIYCGMGKVNLCTNRKVFGVSCGDYRHEGAMAEFIKVPARILYKIPKDLDFNAAAVIEPLTVALHAINRTDIKLGDNVLVVGAGTIGLMLIKLLSISNASKIIVSDLDEMKLNMAKESGATHCFGVDLKEKIQEICPGGVDVVFEAVGITPTVQNSISCVKTGGIVTLVGNVSKTIDFPLQEVVTREINLVSSCASAGEYAKCIELVAENKVDISDIISKVAPLEDGQEWFDRLHSGEKGLIKVVLAP